MKWLFGLLLLACLAFFGFMEWDGAGLGDSKNLQPQPSLNPEKIRLLPAGGLSASSVQTVVQPAHVCMEWGDISGSELARATAGISALKLGNSISQRQVEHVNGYWVYIPPPKNIAEVEKSVAKIKEIGLKEYFVVEEAGKWRNAISLGVFKTEDAAHKYLESLLVKGMKSAKVGERMSKDMITVFVLKDPDVGMMAKMAAIQKDFPESELKAVNVRQRQLTSIA